MKYQFNIQTNRAGQRIVVIDSSMASKNYAAIHYDDFDAVLYLSEYGRLVEHQFMLLNPITNQPFRYKPFFFNPKLTRELLRNASDGCYESIESQGLIDEVERIQKRMTEIHFQVSDSDERTDYTPTNLLMAIVRLIFSRGEDFPEPILKFGSVLGYSYPMFELFIKNKFFTITDFAEQMGAFRNEFSYLEPVKLINTVHLCPKCGMSHLLFTEICPRCSSVDIYSENVIHHFPCANVSPEATYMKGGELICPKCSKQLRHIGVDYDRPMGVYGCHNCSMTFSYSAMQVACTSCTTVCQPDELKTIPIYKEKFTPKGMELLPQVTAFSHRKQALPNPHLVRFKDFVAYLENRIGIYYALQSEKCRVSIIRILGVSDQKLMDAVIEYCFSTNPHLTISFRSHTLLVGVVGATDLELVGRVERLHRAISFRGVELQIDYMSYERGTLMKDFLNAF